MGDADNYSQVEEQDLEFFDEFDEEGEGETAHETAGSIYDTNDFISEPYLTENCDLPEDILEFEHSYGYDCKKKFNLIVPEENVVAFASGNLLNFFDVNEKRLWFRRTAFGEGVGHMCKNPKYPHIAVAENGFNPPIIIYEWPTMEIVCLLKGGSTRRFSQVCYSPDGELFCSQSGEPEYLITIWNWHKHKIMLRVKSYINDVYKVMFSPYIHGALATGGFGHIKFWKMCHTFTGLKLKSQTGRFGKTEISDIVGLYPMKDGKVVSGSEWGNILVWDEGLITKEVTRKDNKTCHSAAITQFDFKNGELITVGLDGYWRVWFFETIESANPPEDARYVAIEPTYELHIAEEENVRTEIMCYEKRKPDDPNDNVYYVQDGNGGILITTIANELEAAKTERIFVSHAGAVADIATCPFGPFLCSLGIDGRLFIYNYIERRILKIQKFYAKGCKMIWGSLAVDPTGSVVLLGFDDGAVRVLVLDLKLIQLQAEVQEIECTRLIQVICFIDCDGVPGVGSEVFGEIPHSGTLLLVIKPHNKPITWMSINPFGKVLATTGEDKTLFFFRIIHSAPINLEPIGFINLESVGTYLTWKPHDGYTVLVCCREGHFYEVDIKKYLERQVETTCFLDGLVPAMNRFVSVKSKMERDALVAAWEEEKQRKIEIKMKEIEKIENDNPGITVDVQEYLESDVEAPPEFPEVYIPPPTPILFGMYTRKHTIWLSVGGFDFGYLYEYTMSSVGPVRTTPLAGATEEEAFCFHILDHHHKHLILGQSNGQIRISKYNPSDFTKISEFWRLSLHDNFNGRISNIAFSWDYKMMFSCGQDGNLFAFNYNVESEARRHSIHVDPLQPLDYYQAVTDIEDYSYPSLEEAKQRSEFEKAMKIANERKADVMSEVKELGKLFKQILVRNKKMPPEQQINHEEFLLDDRITTDMNDRLKAQVDLVNRKLAYDVEKSRIAYQKIYDYYIAPADYFPFRVKAINTDAVAKIARNRELPQIYFDTRTLLTKKMEEEERRKRKPKSELEGKTQLPVVPKAVSKIESFLMGLSPSTIEFRLTARINRLLKQYRARRTEIEERKKQWDELYGRKPIPGINHPDDVKAIQDAEAAIGDFRLKSSEHYKPDPEKRDTTLKKYGQILRIREELREVRHTYNAKVGALRDEKVALIQTLKEMAKSVHEIHREIPKSNRIEFPDIPEMDEETEFPEKNFQINVHKPEGKLSSNGVKDKFEQRTVVNRTDYTIETLQLYSVSSGSQEGFHHVLNNLPEDYEELVDLDHHHLTINELKSELENDIGDTQWEEELRSDRLARKVFEQDILLWEAQRMIKIFDEEVERLVHQRYQVIVAYLFKEHFLVSLIQELLILKEFEAIEFAFEEKINDIQDDLLDRRNEITSLSNQTEASKSSIQQSTDLIKEIQQQFAAATAENRFADFLKRIFKKKFKPPKTAEEMEFSSSSSSDEEDESDDSGTDSSITSEQLMILRLDENVCPPQLDPALFNMAYELRNTRHLHEQKIVEETKNIENYKKSIETARKKMKVVEGKLQVAEAELDEYQKEKQRRLNEVECLMVLKLIQVRNFTEEGKPSRLRDSLLFKKSTLEKLDHRIDELKQETLDQKAKHRKNILHLQRMKADIQYMDNIITELNAEISVQSHNRFGSIVNIEELESSVLRRLVHELRISMVNVRKGYEKELAQFNDAFVERNIEYSNAVQENTEKLNLLAVLEEEKNRLTEILKAQESGHLEKDFSEREKEYENDLNRLVRVTKCQKLQLQALQDEIKILKLKSGKEPKPKERKESDESQIIQNLINDIFKGAPVCANAKCFDNDMIRSMLTELVGILYNEIKHPGQAAQMIQEETLNIIKSVPSPEQFMECVEHIVARIVRKLKKTGDAELEELLLDNVADLFWEMRQEEDSSNQASIHIELGIFKFRKSTTLSTTKDHGSQTTQQFLKELVNDTLKTMDNLETIQLQEAIEELLIILFEQFPAELVSSPEGCSIIIDGLNKAIEGPTLEVPYLPIDPMVDRIMEGLNRPNRASTLQMRVRALVEQLVSSFVKGVLIPSAHFIPSKRYKK